MSMLGLSTVFSSLCVGSVFPCFLLFFSACSDILQRLRAQRQNKMK